MAINRRRFITSLTALGVSACFKRTTTPFPVLEATGSHGEIGHIQGRVFADQIRTNLAFYLNWLTEAGHCTPEHLLGLARAFGPVLETYTPSILEEIDGIARGAGMSLDEILLINARTDVLAIVEAERMPPPIPGCTAMALRGEIDGRKMLTLCQNWDWDPKLADAPVILRIQPADGPALVTLVEAGMAGKIGFNESRLGVCLNFLSHRADGNTDRLGVPIHCLLRAVLNCSTVDEAIATVSAMPRCASANFLLAQHADQGPEAIDLEISPDDVGTIESRSADLIHTNHFLDADLVSGCTSGRGPSTMKRMATAERLAAEFAPTVNDPVIRAQQILQSRAELPYPISRDRNPDPDSSTLAGIIMDLSRNRFIVAAGPPHKSEWVDLPGV